MPSPTDTSSEERIQNQADTDHSDHYAYACVGEEIDKHSNDEQDNACAQEGHPPCLRHATRRKLGYVHPIGPLNLEWS